MADVQIAVIDTIENEVNVAVPGVQGPIGSVAIAQDGTATEPGIRFESDTNTGIYRPGADQLAISTGGTERMRLDSSGRLGIGTSSPGAGLHLTSAGQATSALNTAGDLNFILSESSAAPGNGGSLVFAANSGAWRFASIKGLVQSGLDNTFGDIAFSTRTASTDAALSEKLRITYLGNVGIGTTTPGSALEINAAAATSPFIAKINTAEVARIDSSGRLLVGTSSARTNFANTTLSANLQVEGTGFPGSAISSIRNSNDAFGPSLIVSKSRGTTVGSNTVVNNEDELGSIFFQGNDGSEFVLGARIDAVVDGTPGANDMPGRLVFSVTADGAASPTEALRISNNRAITVSDGGNVVLGTTTGTKIGTATSQKIGFYNATPVVQPTTGVAEAAFVENSGGTAVNVDSTFGGYTIQQVVEALQTLGLLA
jgi:hypothetical protein